MGLVQDPLSALHAQLAQQRAGESGGQKPQPFNDMARTWDPRMPQEQFDDLRWQYFATHVRNQFDVTQQSAAWQDFKQRTERPKMLPSPAVAQLQLGILSAAERVSAIGAKGGLGDPNTSERLQKQKDELITMMHRDGLSTGTAEGLGQTVPDLVTFGAIEAATAGAGTSLAAESEGVPLLADAVKLLGKSALASRMLRGGLTFGTFEAVTAQQGTYPGYAFAKGFGSGAVWEVGIMGLGKLLGPASKLAAGLRNKKADDLVKDLVTPAETTADVDRNLSTTLKREADKVAANHVQGEVQEAQARALPQYVQIDNSSYKPRIRGIQKDGRPFTIEVSPYAEQNSMDQLQQIVKDGGTVQVISGHQDYPSDLIRVLSMVRSLYNEQQHQLSLLATVIDKYGFPVAEDTIKGVKGGTGLHSNSIAETDVKQQFVTHLQHGLERLERIRQADAELAALKAEQAALASEPMAVEGVHSSEHSRAVVARIQQVQIAREEARLAMVQNSMLPQEGQALAGGTQYEQFTMRNGIPGAQGIFADVLEREMPQTEQQSALLRRATTSKSLYIRADGTIAEYTLKDGAPTDYWHPADITERQEAWKLFRQYFDNAKGPTNSRTQELLNELRDYVQQSLAKDPQSFGTRPAARTVVSTTWSQTDPYRPGTHIKTEHITTVPTMPDVLAQLVKHETPAGTKLTATEARIDAKRIMTLWNLGANRAAKEAAADGLKGKGLDYLVPAEWKFAVRQPEASIVKEAPGALQPEPRPGKWSYSDLARLWQREGKPKQLIGTAPSAEERQYMEALQKRTGLQQSTILAYGQMFEKKAPIGVARLRAIAALRVPVVDGILNLPLIKQTRDIFRDIVASRKTMDELFGETSFGGVEQTRGALDAEGLAGTRYIPEDLFKNGEMEAETSLSHERLHIDLNMLRAISPTGDVFKNITDELSHSKTPQQAFDAITTMTQILHGLVDRWHDYSNQSFDSLMEEAWVHPAAVIHAGDWASLKEYGRMDTSVEHVRQMVDAVTSRLAARAEELPDLQELRHLRTSLDDLQLRTGPEHFARWQQAAYKQELGLHLEPETQNFVFRDARGNVTRIFARDEIESLKLVPDHLETNLGFDEQVPSATLQFERMGLRGSPFSRASIVQGTMDKPTPYFMPKSADNFKGLRAAQALFEPMLSWAARTEEAFKKRNVDLGLFDLVKDVDDAARRGTQWHDDMLTSAAKFIPADHSKAIAMMPFMQVQDEVLESMQKTMGVDAKFMENVRGLRQWMTDFQSQTGIQVNQYLRKDLGRLQNFNYSLNAVWPRGVDKSDLARIAQGIANKELNPQDPHIGHFTSWLIREGFEAKFTGTPLRKLGSLLNKVDADGKPILGTLRANVENYINYMKGVPDVTQQIMLKAVGDFQNNLGTAFAGVNKQFGKKILPESFNYPGDWLQKYMLLSYVGGIGLRPAIWARDAMQGVTNTLPIMGPAKFLKGIQALFRPGAWDEAMDAGALLGRHNVQGLYGDIFQEQGPQSGGMTDKAIDAVGKLLSPSRWGHNIARAVAYHGEYESALEAVRAFRANKIDTGKLLEDTSMWFFDAPLQQRLLKEILNRTQKEAVLPTSLLNTRAAFKRQVESEGLQGAAADLEVKTRLGNTKEYQDWQKASAAKPAGAFVLSDEEIAKKIALETVDHTLWSYRRGTQPLFLRTGVGRIFGQYGLWPMSYLDFMRRLTGKLAEHPRKSVQALGLWYGANKVASATFSAAGGDVSKWFFISPAGYGGSPHLQMLEALGQAPENSEQGRAARKTILEYPMNFIPAYLELKNVSKAIANGGHFFNDDWSLTDDAVRVMGMHPKAQNLELSPEEELEYQTGFSHRR
jgi:hypothetical protein